MATRAWGQGRRLVAALRVLLFGPQIVAFAPALALLAFWFGGETALLFLGLGLPLAVALVGLMPNAPALPEDPQAGTGRLSSEVTLRAQAEAALTRARSDGASAVCLRLHFDATTPPDEALRTLLAARMRSVLRPSDVLAWASETDLVILPRPQKRLDSAATMALARRLQALGEHHIDARGGRQTLSVAVGAVMGSRLRAGATGVDLLNAAQEALGSALADSASGLRMQSGPLVRARPVADASRLSREALQALASRRIRAWFQPQLCTDTGTVSGAEALARWRHPERGLISPGVFLPLLEEAGAMPDLSAAMLAQACEALGTWDAAGTRVPMVAVNLCAAELANPALPDVVGWELDRFGLQPSRLCLEILESVVLRQSDPVLLNNLQRLFDMGCRIDLDDFGTGQAPIAALQQFPVNRLKIDRAFVVRVDRDESQRKLVSGLVSLADKMGLSTVAEGVESHGEHATLAQLGVGHVQGFGIARPMPPDQMPAWIARQEARLGALPRALPRAV